MIRGLYILTDKEKAKRKQAHKDRLSKIKTRDYGSSPTLDNTAPNVVNALTTNPRKKALRDEFQRITEQENRYYHPLA